MRAAGRVLVAERLHRVAHAGQRRRRAAAGQAGADDGDHVLVALARADELVLVLPDPPLLVDRAVGDAGVEHHRITVISVCGSGRTSAKNRIGTATKPITTAAVIAVAVRRQNQLRYGLSIPVVCAALHSA